MFTQKEANEFANHVLNNVLAKGKSELLLDFYTEDCIGHFMDRSYNIDNIRALTKNIANQSMEANYEIKNVMVAGNMLTITSNVVWIDRATKKICEYSKIITVWAIRNRKIYETWNILEESDSDIIKYFFQEFGDLYHMFTPDQAREFYNQLYLDVFTNGNVGRLMDFYHPDFIGHCNNEMFDIKDVRDRIVFIQEHLRYIKIETKEIMITNNIITLVNKIMFTTKYSDSIYEISEHITGVIENRKIKETWVISSQQVGPYQQYHQFSWRHQSDLLKPFEINQKSKQYEIENINTALKLNKDAVKLTKQELECLYYYLNGYTAKETALEMKLSPRTIESYISHIKYKFNCKNRFELRNILFPK